MAVAHRIKEGTKMFIRIVRLFILKAVLAIIILTITSITIPHTTFAGEIFSGSCGDNLTWTLDNSGTLIISGTGEMKDYNSFDEPWFFKNESISNVVIENGVTSIGNFAFGWLYNLKSIDVPPSVERIGEGAFYCCRTLPSIYISSNVRSIDRFAFYECSGITNIEVDIDNPTYDSRNDCNAIIETETNTLVCGCMNSVIPVDVLTIGEGAFSCTGLTSIEIPSSVKSIEDSAFIACSSLTHLEIPYGVESIGMNAFTGCKSLESVELPSSLVSIKPTSFSNCDCLISIKIDSDNPKYDSRDSCNAVIETAKDTLIIGCKNSVIPKSVTSIGKKAFDACLGLTSIHIPSNVKKIEIGAFSQCLCLKTIQLSEGLQSIGDLAFESCIELTKIVIPSSVTDISKNAFSDCSGLTEINVDHSNSVYDSRDNCNAIIEKESNTLITGCKNTIIPSSVIVIGDHAFYQVGLTSINIPSGVTSVGNWAFGYCKNLVNVNMPSTVKK